MIDPSSIHITRIWWMLALETFNSILVRFIPSTLPKISSFLSAFSVYIFFAYCLCVYMFTNELLWMLLCRYISSLISLCTSHFPHFDEYLNDFYRMKNTYRNRIILHSTTWIIVHHFFGWLSSDFGTQECLSDRSPCVSIHPIGLSKSANGMFFPKKIRRAKLGLGLFVYFCMIMSDIE